MRNLIVMLSGAILILVHGFAYAQMDLKTVKEAIVTKNAQWRAVEEYDAKNPMRLGLLMDKNPSASGQHMLKTALLPFLLPGAFDWRDVGGENFVTPVRDQGYCGSCWAFGAVAALESATLIGLDSPGIDLDLSEQALVSCTPISSCDGGELDMAAEVLLKQGTPVENCYPYLQHNAPCGDMCEGSLAFQNAYGIRGWGWVSHDTTPDLETLKNMLVTTGPLAVGFMVYQDFKAYQSGIYSYTSGELLGGHGALLVGYDDTLNCFIVKNSWGPAWGENGYFRIAYSETKNCVKFANWAIAYLGAAVPENRMVPGITANGKETLIVPAGESIQIAVSLNPVHQGGTSDVDWWIWFTGPSGQFGWDMESRQWKEGLQRIAYPPVYLNGYPVFTFDGVNGPVLEPGAYTFHLDMDENADGVYDGTWQSFATVVVKR